MESDKDRPKLGRVPCGAGMLAQWAFMLVVGLIAAVLIPLYANITARHEMMKEHQAQHSSDAVEVKPYETP